MNTLAGSLAWLVAALAGLPLVVLIAEMTASLSKKPALRSIKPSQASPSCAILIPAHDEEGGIAATVAALRDEVPDNTTILVVADNCTDQTAQRARDAGALVIERNDKTLRGKGYALAFGRDYLANSEPPEVVVVLDADCRLLAGSLANLVHEAIVSGRPVQAVNLIEPALDAPPMVQVSGFAMLVKNLYRSRGLQRLGGSALLTGTGMAFPWHLFSRAPLTSGSIVEDLALGLDLTRAGHPPFLLEAAGIRSAPAALGDALQQRQRWEHGFLQVLRKQALPTLWSGLRRGSRTELFLGFHLLVPPLALTLLVAIVALSALGLSALAGVSAAPAITLFVLVTCAVLLLVIAWLDGGRPYLSPRALLRAPFYILWKIPIYARFLLRPEVQWRRTPRSHEDAGHETQPK